MRLDGVLMRGRSGWWMSVVFVVLAACGAARCDGGQAAKPPVAAAVAKPRPDLRLLLLTDPRGYLAPCGCSQRPLGGLDKLATAVADARKDGVPTLLLAAGDLTVGSELRPEDAEGARRQEELRAETFVDVWRQIGVSAVTPGPLDLALPAARRAELIERGAFPWLVEGGAAPLAPAQIFDAGGIKVGVLGLVAAEGSDLPALARTASEQLRAQGARVVVALVSGDRRLARVIAGKGPDVVVMGGLDLEQPVPPSIAGEALIVHAGYQGQSVLELELSLAPGEWEDASGWSAQERARERDHQIAELRARIAEWEQASNVAKSDLDVQRERLAKLKAERAEPAKPTYSGRWFDAELVQLAPEVRADPRVSAVLDAHDRKVNEANRELLKDREPVPAAEGQPHYAGSDSCRSCHQQAYDWWKDTKHGRAYATLERVHKEFNLSCVGCHVTGYNRPGGSTVTHVDGLKDVGCENCHGPAAHTTTSQSGLA